MLKQKTIRKLRIKSDDLDSLDSQKKKDKVSDDFGGRKVIIFLFLFTIFISFIFWMKSGVLSWLRDFMGPSTWTFSR